MPRARSAGGRGDHAVIAREDPQRLAGVLLLGLAVGVLLGRRLARWV